MYIDKHRDSLTKGQPEADGMSLKIKYQISKIKMTIQIKKLFNGGVIGKFSEHPLAEAIVIYAKEKSLALEKVIDLSCSRPGRYGKNKRRKYYLGNRKLMSGLNFLLIIVNLMNLEEEAKHANGFWRPKKKSSEVISGGRYGENNFRRGGC